MILQVLRKKSSMMLQVLRMKSSMMLENVVMIVQNIFRIVAKNMSNRSIMKIVGCKDQYRVSDHHQAFFFNKNKNNELVPQSVAVSERQSHSNNKSYFPVHYLASELYLTKINILHFTILLQYLLILTDIPTFGF